MEGQMDGHFWGGWLAGWLLWGSKVDVL